MDTFDKNELVYFLVFLNLLIQELYDHEVCSSNELDISITWFRSIEIRLMSL